MVDITNKISTLRVAKAQATVSVSKQETIDAIINKAVPKGDVFASSKTTGLLGVKKTAELLPDCHPMPIEYCGIDFEINDLDITITVEVKTIYKTGVEVEAMHGASIVALNVYDMLKPIDKGIEINNIKIKKKYNFLNLTIVFIISFVALVILLDTFKNIISKIFPNLEFLLYNLYETIIDIVLFIGDLI